MEYIRVDTPRREGETSPLRSAENTIVECWRMFVAFDPGDSTGVPPWRKIGVTRRKLSLGF